MKTKTLFKSLACAVMCLSSLQVFAQLTAVDLSNPRAGAAHYVDVAGGEQYTDTTTHERSQFVSIINDSFAYNPNDMSNANAVINQGDDNYLSNMYFCRRAGDVMFFLENGVVLDTISDLTANNKKDSAALYAPHYYDTLNFLDPSFGDSAYHGCNWASVDFTIPRGKMLNKFHFWGRNNSGQFGEYYRMGVMLEDKSTGLRHSTTEYTDGSNNFFKFCDNTGSDPDGLQYFNTLSFTDKLSDLSYASHSTNAYMTDGILYSADRMYVMNTQAMQVGLMIVEMRLACVDAPSWEIASFNSLPSQSKITKYNVDNVDLEGIQASLAAKTSFKDVWGYDTCAVVTWDNGGFDNATPGTYTITGTVSPLPLGCTDNDASVGEIGTISFDIEIVAFPTDATLMPLHLFNPRGGVPHYGVDHADRSNPQAFLSDPFLYNPNDMSNAAEVSAKGAGNSMYYVLRCPDDNAYAPYNDFSLFLDQAWPSAHHEDYAWVSVDFEIPRGKMLDRLHFWGRDNNNQNSSLWRTSVMLEDVETGLRHSTTEYPNPDAANNNAYFKLNDGPGDDGLKYFNTVLFSDNSDDINYNSNEVAVYFTDNLLYKADRFFLFEIASGNPSVGPNTAELRLAIIDAPAWEIDSLSAPVVAEDTTVLKDGDFDLAAWQAACAAQVQFKDVWGYDTTGVVTWDNGGFDLAADGTYTVTGVVALPMGTVDTDASAGVLAPISFSVIVGTGVNDGGSSGDDDDDPYTYVIDEKPVAYWNFENVTKNLGEDWTSQMGDVTTSWNAYKGEAPAEMIASNDREIYHFFGNNANFDFSSAHMITDKDPLADAENGSISMWMCRRSSDNQYRGWISHNVSSNNYWAINTSGDTKTDFRIGGKNNYYQDTVLSVNKWYHIVATYENTVDTTMKVTTTYTFDTLYYHDVMVADSMHFDTLTTVIDTAYVVDTVSYGRVYINGTLQDYVIGGTDRTKRPKLYNEGRDKDVVWKFGEDRESKRRPRGMMDEVAMFDKALTPEQVKAIYDGGLMGKPIRTIPVEGASLNEASVSMKKGERVQLEYALVPTMAEAFKGFAWSSSDESVVKVDKMGKVSAIGAGSAKVAMTYKGDMGITDTCEFTVSALESVALNKEAIDLKKGANETLTFTYNPSDFDLDSTFVWSCSDDAVATVDQNGKVVAIGGGQALVVLSYNDPIYDIKDTCVVTVKDLESVSASADSLVFEIGGYEILQYTYAPMGVELDSTFNWSTSDADVATVDASGVVMAVGVGQANVIIAYTAEGIDVQDTVFVIVNGPESVAINVDSLVLDVDATASLTYAVDPQDAVLANTFLWSSSDEDVVTIDQDGNVTAVAAGVADLIVAYGNTNYKVADTCKVVVNEISAINNTFVMNLSVYPNPAENMVIIDGLTKDSNVQVYSLSGMRVLDRVVKVEDKQLDVSGLVSGMYILDVEGANVKLQIK